MAAYNIEKIKDKKKLVKLANYGTAERRNMRPKVLIGAGEEKPFIEGDILDANATLNLIEDTYDKGRIFRSFSKEGKKIDKEIKELLEKTDENYEQLSSAIADNKEDADQKIDQLSSKVDNIESNIPNLRRVVDIQLQSVLDGTKTYLVTKQGDVQEQIQISDGEKGEQGEKGDPFTYEDFTPEQIEGLKVKGDRGVSISSLEQTQTAYTSGGVNEFTITLDDGTVSKWYVRNGQKGDATKIWVNANTVHSGYYDSDNHEIKLLNADGGIMSVIDATAFIKDGMISDAYVEDGYIVIVFNTDSGKTPIMIPVTDIFDADDYYTKLDTDARIAEDVLVETQRAEAAELQLTDNLAQEVSDRQSGDTTLNTKIETETTRATNAEEALSDAIDAEESTRIQEIDDLQDLLDAYIQSNNAAVQAEISRATAAEQTNATAIATESSRAQSAEQNLQSDIDAEERRAVAAELDLLDAVDELEQSAGQGITEVQQALSDEVTRATGAESQLSSDLSAEITRATNANNANATAISNEVARATLSELQNATDIDAIEALIPSQATSENQLADKAFVNSSIATNTATFVGTFNSITDLYAVTTADVNDYGYVVTTDSVGNTKYNRYKYDGSQWGFEYALNNSSFTAEEWAAIQSGMTQALRIKLENLPSTAVTSVGVSVPTGLTVTGSPITSSGTIAINFTSGYSIPTTSSLTNWDTAYGWGNHANANYVKSVKVGTDTYNPSSGIVSLPAYPTTLPASDVYSWAKASTKPSYTLDEISDGSTRKLANYLPLSGGTLSSNNSWLSPARLQLMRPDTTAYTDRACIGVTDGNLHIDSYPNHHLYLNFYSGSSEVYIGDGTTNHQYKVWHAGNLTNNNQLSNGAGYITSSGDCHGATYLNFQTVSTSSLESTTGCFAFSTSSIIIGGNDYIGLQLDSGVDKFQITAEANTLYFRLNDAGGSNTNWNPWVSFITSATIGSQNAGSATKLQTARTIWGQNFDGSGSVDGTLHINGIYGNYAEGIRLHPSTAGWITIALCGSDNTGASGTTANSWNIHKDPSNSFFINRGNSNNHTGYEICNVSGNWGIATTSPSYKLHVAGVVCSDLAFLFRDDATLKIYSTTGGISSDHETVAIQSCIDGQDPETSSGIYVPTKLPSRCVIALQPRGGRVGIGITTPSYPLHVNGDAAATNFYTTSDSSKKDNIILLSEHIRKFTLKETGKEHYGVIAQEVEEMFREGEEGSYTVNYNSILSYYIGLLENRVAELENKVKELSHG